MIVFFTLAMKSSNYVSLPVYQRSLALKDLSTAVASYFSYDSDLFVLPKKSGLRNEIANALFIDASLISKNLVEAATASSKKRRNKNITYINIMTRNILAYCNGLEKDGVKEKEYVQLLRKEIRSFRADFKQWRKSLISSED